MVTDEELVCEAKRGSAAAFEQLVARYQGKLLRFLLSRSASRADAEDALQETFVNAYRYLASYDDRWRFSTWLYRIAIRNLARCRQGPPGEGEVVDAAPDPLEECILASDRENLWLVARRSLSADAFAAMWLRYAEDMPVKDVARALGRPSSWTRVVLLRARRRLMRDIQAGEAARERKAYG